MSDLAPAWRPIAGAALAAGLVVAGAVPAAGQELPESVFDAQDLLRRPGTVDPLLLPLDKQTAQSGIVIGPGLVVTPTAEVGPLLNTNVFGTPRGDADVAASVAPDVTVRSREGGAYSLGAYVHSNVAVYSDHRTENVLELFGGVDLDRPVAPDTRFRARVEGGRYVQDRAASFELVNTRSPIKFERIVGAVGLTVTPGRFIVSPSVEIDRLAVHDNRLGDRPDIVFVARDRSYVRINPELVVGYAVSPITAVFAGVEANSRDYDLTRVPDRDSTGYAVYGGIRFRPTPLTRVDLALGYIQQNYVRPLTSPSAPYIRAAFLYSPTRLTRVRADIRRDVSETGGLAVGGAVRTRAGVDVEHRLFRDIWVQGGAELRRFRFPTIDRTDVRVVLTAGVTRLVNRAFDVFVRGEQLWSDSNASVGLDYNFSRTRVVGGLRLRA